MSAEQRVLVKCRNEALSCTMKRSDVSDGVMSFRGSLLCVWRAAATARRAALQAVLFWNYFVELKVCRHTSGYLPRPRPRPPRPRPPRPRPATGASDAMRRLNAAERFESPPRAAFFAALRASRAINCSARARSSAESEDGSSLNFARSSALRRIVTSSACAPHADEGLGRFGGASPTGAAARLAARRASAAADRGARADDGAGAGADDGAGAGAGAGADAGTGAATAPARRAARRAIAAGERFSALCLANCSWRVICGAAGTGVGAGAGARAARLAARRASAAALRLRSISCPSSAAEPSCSVQRCNALAIDE